MTQFQTNVPPDKFAEWLGEEPASEEEEQEEVQSGEEPATALAAEAVSETVLGHELEEYEKAAAGQIVHYSFGTTAGMAYGVMAEAVPEVTVGGGLPFGAAFWLAADEIGVPAVGLAEPPWEHPLSTHLYGLAAHLLYGATLETARRMLRGIL